MWPVAAAVLAGVPLLLLAEGAAVVAFAWTAIAGAGLAHLLSRDPAEG
jgi:hypothetical protein